MILNRRRKPPTGVLTVTYGGQTYDPVSPEHALWHIGAAFTSNHLSVLITLPSGLSAKFYAPIPARDFIRYNI